MKNLREWKKQVIKFGIIGVLAVLTDMGCYYLLLNILPEKLFSFISNEVAGKTISFICGAVVTYNLNKWWTWRKKDSSRKRFVKFMLLYFTSLAINVATNSSLLYLLYKYRALVNLPLINTLSPLSEPRGISAAMNFLGQKFSGYFIIKQSLHRKCPVRKIFRHSRRPLYSNSNKPAFRKTKPIQVSNTTQFTLESEVDPQSFVK